MPNFVMKERKGIYITRGSIAFEELQGIHDPRKQGMEIRAGFGLHSIGMCITQPHHVAIGVRKSTFDLMMSNV